MRKGSLLFLLLWWLCRVDGSPGQVPDSVYCTAEDRAVFDRYVQAMQTERTLPAGELIIETARFFLGTPYVASTLEKEPEQLVVNLREMDCTTLVETCIALAHTVKSATPSFETFCRHLRQIRYRDSAIRGYADRLHYFSDWIYENERKGLIRDVTRQIGGKPHRITVSFMSAHPESYRQLKSHPRLVEVIREKEREISARKGYALIPEASVAACGDGMKNGDIVCFVTRIEGLDISHLGFIYRQGDVLSFIHASSSARKVIVESRSPAQYVADIRTTVGLMIVRPEQE
ncbi:MAG: DUF1460 domain-containing protein [Tannerella sp.]|jgi:hypothetical protein|nr:DUF1460 domain-containing protein [Tannerella sp.]